MVNLVDRLDVMLGQEDKIYKTVDYLDPAYQHALLVSTTGPQNNNLDSSSLSSSSGSSSSLSGINESWREKIVEWSYQVIDHFDFSREVVSVSTHYLDRFLATRHVNKEMFQLAAMATLFLAVKLYEPGKVTMQSMIELCRGHFTVDQMEAMELEVLSTLGWQVHPPTAYCFSQHILFLLPYTSPVSTDVRHDVVEMARFLTELSVTDYFFVGRKPSSVALAALYYSLNEHPNVPLQARNDFVDELEKIAGLNLRSPEVLECHERLHYLYAQSGFAETTNDETISGETRIETISPVCVSYGISAQHVAYGVATAPQQGQPEGKTNAAAPQVNPSGSGAVDSTTVAT